MGIYISDSYLFEGGSLSQHSENKFGDLPDVPELVDVGGYEEAVNLLFSGNAENICVLNVSGGELHRAYEVLYQGQRCFVKIIVKIIHTAKNMFYSYPE